MSMPLYWMMPSVGSSRRRTVLPTVVLPQPDSTTSPSVSPGAMVNDTSSTAFTVAILEEKMPEPESGTLKYLRRPSTLRIGWLDSIVVAVAADLDGGRACTSVPAAISSTRTQADA